MNDLTLERVTKRYGNVVAVDDVSLGVEAESFFSLLGPSGCGKTTILRMVAGFVRPDSGSILIRDEPMTRVPPYRRDTALVFQNYALFPHLSVFDNVAFGLRYRGVPRDQFVARVGAALEQVKLAGFGLRMPSQLSGGQQQRVALARAIVTEPALLLLDEPLSNLDLRLRQEMRRELVNIQRSVRITTIYVTHDQSEAFSMSDQLAIISGGRVMQVGSPKDVYQRPANEFVLQFIGETNALDCVVREVSASETVVTADSGLELHAAHLDVRRGYGAGSRVRVYFREEQASLAVSATSQSNSFGCVISQVQYLGAMLSYSLTLDTGDTLRVTLPNIRANEHALGSRLFVEIAAADCVVIMLDGS